MTISIVIPALNEARCIARTLRLLRDQAEEPFEVIVVDGGSTDETVALASPHATVISSERGRANQMIAGAGEATGDVLLFLHADTELPPGALKTIRRTLDSPRTEAGAFRLRFDRETPLLRLYSYCTRFRQHRFCFGDRALFVARTAYEEAGGFSPIPIFEDLDLVRRLHDRGTFAFLPQYVTTSARRFERKGPLSQQLLNAYLWIRYMLGASPHDLAHHYTYEASQQC